MTDEEAALICGVCAAPFDMAPRLVYADWLDEHGRGSHAWFIREWVGTKKRQVAVHEPDGPAVMVIPKDGRGDDNLVDWERLELAPAVPGVRYVTRRGFVSEVRFETNSLYEAYFEALFRLHPITGVRIEQVSFSSTINSVGQEGFTYVLGRRGATWGWPVGDGYSSTAAAREGLSRAAVDHARKVVGLPAIDWEQVPQDREVCPDDHWDPV